MDLLQSFACRIIEREASKIMKNKQHEYILKAFLKARIPAMVRRNAPNLIAVDSAPGGYCIQLIKQSKLIKPPIGDIISKDEKVAFAELIDHSTGVEKEELVVYYRLAVLVEAVVIQYCQ